MLQSLNSLDWLAIVGCAVTVTTGIIGLFRRDLSWDKHVVLFVTFLSAAIFFVQIFESTHHEYEVNQMSKRIISTLSGGAQTEDRIKINLNFPDPKTFNDAFEFLSKNRMIFSAQFSATLPSGQTVDVKLWRL